MSGHSHWATIRHKKEVQDKARGSLFAKISKEITISLQKGGGVTDPDLNVYLRTALQKAKDINLPKENIQRIIDRSKDRAQHLQEAVYEGFGPGGSAYVITVVTDNTNRTLTDLRTHFSRLGGKLGAQGSVIFLFRHSGIFTIDASIGEEKILSAIDQMGAFDFETEEGTYYVYIDFDKLSEASQKARNLGFDTAPQITYVPISPIALSPEDFSKALNLKDALEELDDVQEVQVNFHPI